MFTGFLTNMYIQRGFFCADLFLSKTLVISGSKKIH